MEMFPLCARWKRTQRFAVPCPDDAKTRDVWILIAHAAGWKFSELAHDWDVSNTRIQQLHKRAKRRQKVIAAQLEDF